MTVNDSELIKEKEKFFPKLIFISKEKKVSSCLALFFVSMNLIFNRNPESHSIPWLPIRYILTAYSNLGYVSTPDLTVDHPSIYSIQQDIPTETDADVIGTVLFFSFSKEKKSKLELE